MKHKLLLTALSATLLFSTTSRAQVPVVNKLVPKVLVGIKLGANMQKLTGNTFDNSFKPGIVGGAFLSVRKGKMGVRAEALVKSAKFDISTSSSNYVKTISMDIPLLFEYKLINRLWVQVGPQFTSLLTAKNNNDNDVKNSFNTSDVSGVIGLEAILPVHLTLSARYIMGFSDVNNSGVGDAIRNRSIQIALGFRFL